MYFLECDHKPGTVIIVSHELSRYSDFSISLVRLKAPVGSIMFWQKSVEIVKSINHGIRNMQGEWVFILGDDHAFHGDVLMHLLDSGKEVIAPMCAQRAYPFYPVAYLEDNGDMFKHGPWGTLEPFTIMEVAGIGSAGMLIRKNVLDAVGDPWFEVGQMNREHISEDLHFCRKVRQKGFKVCVDTRQALGHITPATILPIVLDGKLVPTAMLNGDEKLRVRLDVGYTNMPEKPQTLSLLPGGKE